MQVIKKYQETDELGTWEVEEFDTGVKARQLVIPSQLLEDRRAKWKTEALPEEKFDLSKMKKALQELGKDVG